MDAGVDELLRRIREEKDGEAIQDFRSIFYIQMLNLIRIYLADRPDAAAFDPEGIFQEAFRSFISNVHKPNFDSRRGEVAALLSTIVVRKVYKARRKQRLIALDFDSAGGAANLAAAFADGELSEQEINFVFSEAQIKTLCLFKGIHKKIIQKSCDPFNDFTRAQIAKECRCPESVVDYVLDLFFSELQDEVRRGRSDGSVPDDSESEK